MFKKILVPLDGSQLSQRSLEPALALSEQTGAELLLVRVPTADTLSFAVSEARQRELAQNALVYLETIRKSNEQPHFSIRTQVLDGDVASAIIDAAHAEQSDLIIMSTHGYSGLTRWVLGSVTEKVLRSAPCPVLAIRAARHPQRILITLDGSSLAERAIESGLSLAQSLKAEVTMLRCVPHIVADGKLDEHERGLSRRLQEDLLNEAKEYLRARAADAAQAGVAIKTQRADWSARRQCPGVRRNVRHRPDRDGDAWPHRVEALGLRQRDCQSAAQCQLFNVSRSADRRRVELAHPIIGGLHAERCTCRFHRRAAR